MKTVSTTDFFYARKNLSRSQAFNIMTDRRIVKGNTFGAIVIPISP
jgi:hypothetical protein